MIQHDLKVCLFPMQITWGDKEENLKRLEESIAKIHPQTDLLILPETFSTGFPAGKDKEDVRLLAERNTGSTIDLLKSLSQKYKMAICGTFIADSGGSLYNRAFFIEPSGDELFEDKRHLFTMANEQKVFSRGYKRLKIRYRGWNLAMVICYDIRFPVWCRNVNNEYDALIVVANWPEVRTNAWNSLLPARAIENETYVCAVNCKGTDSGGFSYDGSSAVFDFKGKNVSAFSEDGCFVYGTLSRERIDAFRKKFPAWADSDKFVITE